MAKACGGTFCNMLDPNAFLKEFLLSLVHWTIAFVVLLLGGAYILASFGFWVPLAAVQSNDGGIWFVAIGTSVVVSILTAVLKSRR